MEGLVALLLAAGQVDVQGALEEALVDAEPPGLRPQCVVDGGDVASPGPGRLGQQCVEADARHLGGVLQAQEEPRLRTFPRRQAQQVDAVDGGRSTGHRVAGATHQDMGGSTCPSRSDP